MKYKAIIYQVVIGRGKRFSSTGIPDPGTDDSLGCAEESLRKPESAHPERRLLRRDLGLEQGHGWCSKVADLRERL